MKEQVVSPLKGELIEIARVSDPMFSQKMLGDGVAILPKGKELYSPVSGEITMIYDTQHAIGIKTAEGKDILIHIGIDTVNLKGKPFKTKVKVGDKVQKGQLLTVVDWRYIKWKKCDPVVPLIVMGSSIEFNGNYGDISVGEPLFNIL